MDAVVAIGTKQLEDMKKELVELEKEQEVAAPEPAKEEEVIEKAAEEVAEEAHEVAEEAEEAEQQEEEPNKSSYARLRHEAKKEREAREKAEREASELRGMIKAQEMARQQQQQQPQSQPQQKEPEEVAPDKSFDPIGYLDHKQRELEKKTAKYEELLNQHQQERQLSMAKEAIRSLESEYAKQKPEYTAAKEYLRTKYFEALRFTNPPHITDYTINQHLDIMEAQTASAEVSAGRNPAAYFERLAHEKGYQPNAKETKAKPNVDLNRVAETKRRSLSLVGSPSNETANNNAVDVLNAGMDALLRTPKNDLRRAFDKARDSIDKSGRPF